MADQEALPHSYILSSSTVSSTDLENIQGPLTLAQLINEIELVTGSLVSTLLTGRRSLGIYSRNFSRPVVDVNLLVSDAVAQREAHSCAKAQARTAANAAVGRGRISPKKVERINTTIYFTAVCEDYREYSLSWHP